MLPSSYLVLIVNQFAGINVLSFLLRQVQFRAGQAERQHELVFGRSALLLPRSELRIVRRLVAKPV
jgi:hypothetical protein